MYAFYLPSQIMTCDENTVWLKNHFVNGSFVEAIHKLVNYAFLCESFCASNT